MEKEEPLSVCDSDSSDGLPELFPKYTFDVAELIKNDIVWAKYKNLYWPALVRNVDKKNKKVTVWYLDSPGTCFKVTFKKIHDFADSDFCKKVEADAKLDQKFGKKHAEVLRRTNLFMFRRFQGIGDDPLEFFDLSKPYFLLKDLNSGISDIKFNNVGVSTENVRDKKDNLTENSEDESDVESSNTTKCLSELYEEDGPYDDEMVDKILSYITSGHVDNYLIDIVNSEIANKRHELYVKAVENDQVQLFVESQPSIPIKNQKLHNVSIYLHSLYKQKIGKKKPRLNEYIVSVWLPEAVNKTISLIEAESMKLPDDSCGNNKSSSPLEAEAWDLTHDPGSNKFSSSPILVESSELPMDCGNKVSSPPTEVEVSESLVGSGSNSVSSSPFQVEPSESPVDSSSNNVLCAPRRKLHLRSSLVKNYNVNELEIEVCTPSKKKFTGRKKQKRSSKTLKPGKKTPQKMDKPQEENLVFRK
ncbi:hypothetical protein AVEN_146485-1 [Araneus ventricosus]|uniref:PWWP domain-containing protein n=1 Tax=Araneus ventricosus TaxID=182803 RepID=A0A4Y2RWE2_ARAVE|nr:hypothetical protein AVEN_146485-1 [Araneus ventricosus]